MSKGNRGLLKLNSIGRNLIKCIEITICCILVCSSVATKAQADDGFDILSIIPAITRKTNIKQGLGSVYYIDAINGNDSNNGLSVVTAWKTVRKVNESSFRVGDNILFKKGTTWNEELIVSSSGGLNNPLTYGSYGSGVNPIIDATNLSNGIDINKKNYITINGIDIKKANQDGIVSLSSSSYIVITNCKVTNCGGSGIKVWSGSVSSNNWTVVNNEITYNKINGVDISGYCNNFNIENNIIHDNCSSTADDYLAGIKIINPTIYNMTIQNNKVYSNGVKNAHYRGAGIWLDTIGTGSIIRYNNCYKNNYVGIKNEATSNTLIYYNILYNNNDSGIDVSRICHNCQVYNNTCYANHDGITIIGDYPPQSNNMINNLIKNNISVGNISRQLFTANGGENIQGGSGNIYTNNCFGIESSNFIEWGNGGTKSNYAAWEASYGGPTHSIQGDSQLVNPISDFHLQPSSPCINAGVNVGLTRDFYGNSVPKNGGPDIGAAEY